MPTHGSTERAPEGPCLELVSALHALGSTVHAEWPHGKPLRLRARARRASLRGSLKHDAGYYLAEAALDLGDASLGLGELLALVTQTPGRFIRLADGDYLELEQDMRDMLDAMPAVRSEARGQSGRTAIPASAIPVLDELTRQQSGFTLDRGSAEWRAD